MPMAQVTKCGKRLFQGTGAASVEPRPVLSSLPPRGGELPGAMWCRVRSLNSTARVPEQRPSSCMVFLMVESQGLVWPQAGSTAKGYQVDAL